MLDKKAVALSEAFSDAGLISGKEGFWQSAFAHKFERPEVLTPRPLGHFGVAADPVRELNHFILRDLPESQAVFKVAANALRRVLPGDVRNGLIPIIHTKDLPLDFFPTPVGSLCVGLILEGSNRISQFPLAGLGNFIDELRAGAQHRSKLLSLEGPCGFGERLTANRSSRFDNALHGDQQRAVVLEMTHLKNLVPKVCDHFPHLSRGERDVSRRQLAYELLEGKHPFQSMVASCLMERTIFDNVLLPHDTLKTQGTAYWPARSNHHD